MLDLDVRWNHGAPGEPAIQVHQAADDTVILRQSIAVDYEAPFLYLLFGAERALLLDTGATADAALFPLRATIDGLVAGWLARHPRDGYELVVAHSHAHGDHIAGDAQFEGRPRTTVVGHEPDAVAGFFGITPWPGGSAGFDLGGRLLRVLPIPGHHPSSIAIHDERTGVLLSGDTVYPGRLYVADFPAFEGSLARLCAFADAHPISHILGAHIEMSTTPGRDYPLGSTWHPREAALPMTVAQLHAIRDAAALVANRRGAHRFDDFAIHNET